jgi:putative tricarboxylic transport membrane protein
MARRGEGARALGIATFGSMIGGLFGCVGMVSLAWPLTILAMKIGPPEYFALGIMALTLISIASKGETLKGLIMGCVGLAFSFIGNDPVSGFVDRFSFGSVYLAGGIPFLAVILGIFAVAQIIRMFEEGGTIVQEAKLSLTIWAALDGFLDILRHPLTVIRSLGIGIYIGILPVVGPGTATVTSYIIEKKYSHEKEQFGQGAPSGLIATEVSKGCCSIGDMIPTFMLGIPGSITGAIIMAAFILHGIQPGPQFLLAGSKPYIVFAGIILAQILFVITGLPLIKVIGHIVKVPNVLLAPILTVLCFIGAFVDRNIIFDILLMIAFGIFGYGLDRLKYPLISLVIGLIIGPLVEENFHRTIGMGYGSLNLFWTRPIAISFFIITFLFLTWPYIKGLFFLLAGKVSKEAETLEISTNPEKITIGEIILLSSMTAFGLLIVVEGSKYPGIIGLFPIIIGYLMLALIAFRSGSLIFRHVRFASVKWRMPWLSLGSMSWEWSIGALIGYFLLISIIGFLGTTAIYLIVIPTLLRYRKKFLILIMGGGVTLGVAIFVRFLHIIFPRPFWM